MKAEPEKQTSERLPKEVLEGCLRWIASAKEVLSSKKLKISSGDDLMKHADWGSIVRWAKIAHAESLSDRLALRGIVHLSQRKFIRAIGALALVGVVDGLEKLLDVSRVELKHPAGALIALGKFLLTRRAYATYVEPFVADIDYEYLAARESRRYWLSWWVVVRGYAYVVFPLLAGASTTLRALWKLWRD